VEDYIGMTKKSEIKRTVFSTRLDPDLVKKLKHIAVDEKKPMSQLLEEAIVSYLRNIKKGK
jgi:predicted transcriptional regulator